MMKTIYQWQTHTEIMEKVRKHADVHNRLGARLLRTKMIIERLSTECILENNVRYHRVPTNYSGTRCYRKKIGVESKIVRGFRLAPGTLLSTN